MNLVRPSVQQERWLAAISRYLPKQELIERTGGWKTGALVSRCLFFVLGLVAAGTILAIFHLLEIPQANGIAGLVLLGAAEWLIQQRRFFWSGIEEALWASGLIAISVGIIETITRWDDIAAALLIAVALLLAGWRLLNPLFTTAGAGVASVAVGMIFNARWSGSGEPVASLFCFALATVALISGSRSFKRPAHDRMLDWLVVAMPAAGCVWTEISWSGQQPESASGWSAFVRWLPLLMSLTFGIAAAWIGIRRRTHSPLLAALVCTLCIAYTVYPAVGMDLEWYLFLWGGAALLPAIAIERYLRTPRKGITSKNIGDSATAQKLLEVMGTAVMAPQTAQTPPESAGYQGQGGGFGGGGASGRY